MNTRVQNKLGGRAKTTGVSALMRPGIIMSMVLISIFSLGALLTLSGFAGDLRDTNNGQAHALSNSAIGYAGIVTLLRAQDKEVILQRTEGVKFDRKDTLHVVTFTHPYQLSALDDIDRDTPTLVVLPKWRTVQMPERSGWVKRSNVFGDSLYDVKTLSSKLDAFSENSTISRPKEDDGTRVYDIDSRDRELPVTRSAGIENLQSIESDDFMPLMTAGAQAILAKVNGSRIYILSEPDLLNTAGISQLSRAELGYSLLTGLIDVENAELNAVIFDLNVHGFGRTQNLIKTLLTPPFLAATLCLLAAGALVGWQAFARFGDPARTERDYALGKYTLADNGARFIHIADKERGMAAGYVALIKRLASKDFYLDKQNADKVDEFIETRETHLGIEDGFVAITTRLENAADINEYLDAARALYDWRQEITHDR